MKSKLAAAVALLCCLLSCSDTKPPPPGPSPTPTPSNDPPVVTKAERSINEAQSEGESVTVTGVSIEKLRVSVSATHPGRIFIPVGSVFQSESAGTQTMMSAKAAVLTFAGDPSEAFFSPQTQTIDLEVYCINRFLDAPTPSSEFTVISGGAELDPVRRLAECLDHHPEAPHGARQLAIWVSSDNFINLTDAEVRAKMRAHVDETITDPNSQAWASARDEKHLTEEQVREIIADPNQLETVRASAYEEVETEISDYKTIAGPLLEKCGFDITTSKFFQTS